MEQPIDYDKFKTNRAGLYVLIVLILLIVLGVSKQLDHLEQLQPCKPESTNVEHNQ